MAVTPVTFRLELPFLQSKVTLTESPGLMSLSAADCPLRVTLAPSVTVNDRLRRALLDDRLDFAASLFTPNVLAVKLTTVPAYGLDTASTAFGSTPHPPFTTGVPTAQKSMSAAVHTAGLYGFIDFLQLQLQETDLFSNPPRRAV
ncbi:MAG: hypothetical protein HZA91_00100 [Verrucomicrobia bacterium]|nr:hypothetical protein [Verrucomicrobiota bacterium]